jgi:hypothetical protein
MSFYEPQGANSWIQHFPEYNYTYENLVRDERTTIMIILKRPCHEEFTHCQKVDAQADRC